MKYIWIIMLVVIDVIWIIASVLEIVRGTIEAILWSKKNHYSLFDFIDSWFTEIEDFAHGCLWGHILILFLYSLFLFISSSGVAE